MAISGTYDIYNSLFRFQSNYISIQNPQLDFIFKGVVASKYTNQINNVLSTEINTFMNAFKDQLGGMDESISTLFSAEEKQFKLQSDLQVNIIGQVNNKPTISQFSLQVSQLAKPQKNISDSFDSKETKTVEPGIKSLQINFQDKEFDFDIEVKSYDNNKSIFNTIAKEVNSADIGINAGVSEDEYGNVSLSFEGEETGESNGFTLNGELADIFNLSQITQEAQNAEYMVDDELFESEENTITLDNNNIQLQLQETIDLPITIEINENNSTIESVITDFTEQFNEFKGLLEENLDNRQVNLISNQFDNLTSRFESILSDIGIQKKFNGTLEIDEDKLNESIKNNPDDVREVFTEIGSFGNQFQSRINSIQTLPESLLIDNKITDNSSTSIYNAYTYLSDAQKLNLTLFQSQGTLIDMMF